MYRGADDSDNSLQTFRRDLHQHPELGFAEHRTSAQLVKELEALGLEVATGIGGTGIVATLRNGPGTGSIGLRADMDALPFDEETGLPYASVHQGAFHGCGHDGHMAMLLGAARRLVAEPNFSGTVYFIFQPAEEGLGGGRAMVRDGLFDRFPCDRIFALHNWPDLPAGSARTRPGPIMASADRFHIELKGKGGHAAMPHQTPDAVLAAAQLVTQLNTIVSRRIDPVASAVVSVTQIAGGRVHNVIPAVATVGGTVRTFDVAVQDRIEQTVREMTDGIARSFEVEATILYDRYYPATINDPLAAEQALNAARAVCDDVAEAPDPAFTSEDFSFMLQERPGAYLWLGQGTPEHRHPLHHPQYDFNDAVMPLGIGWFVALAEQLLPLS